MQIKRAVILGVLLYIVTFIVGIVVSGYMGLNLAETDVTNLPPIMWYVSAGTAVVLMALFSWVYLRSPQVESTVRNGFLFGIISLIVGFIMDLLVFIPPVFSGSASFGDLLAYYQQPAFLVTLILIPVVGAVVGFVRR